jgi:hypothetical protein
VPIDLDEALRPPETDRDFIGRLVQETLGFMDQGELIAAAERLGWASSVLRRIEAAPREWAKRNRKRRERRAVKRERLTHELTEILT